MTVNGTRDSSVGVVIRLKAWTVDESGFDCRQCCHIFLFCKAFRPALGPPSLPFNWCRWVKQSGREAGHSPPTSAEVKNEWSCTSTPSYAFLTCTRTTLHSLKGNRQWPWQWPWQWQWHIIQCSYWRKRTKHKFMVWGMCIVLNVSAATVVTGNCSDSGNW
jgi:hypothetical protein